MDTATIIYIILSFLTALSIALFQYWTKTKPLTSQTLILVFLRIVAIFGILLLLINPKFVSNEVINEKPKLVIAVDNSASIAHLNQSDIAVDALNRITNSADLNSRFDVKAYEFGSQFSPLDSLNFNDNISDFETLLSNYEEIYKQDQSALLLVSDGNQTYGSDYQFLSKKLSKPIYPIVLGDTTSIEDLRIERTNHNRYVFYKNKFEIEIICVYNGENSVNSNLTISNAAGTIVFNKALNFNKTKKSYITTAVLTANTLGIQNYKITLASFEGERNLINNSKEFAIEVIDQKTNVAIVSSRPHPDVGALKKSITSNEQRNADILTVSEYLQRWEDYQLAILYQPDNSFNELLPFVYKQKLNTFLITGPTTNWNLINQSQDYFKQEITNQEEQYQPVLNNGFSPFIVNSLTFSDFPPLTSEFGNLEFNTSYSPLLFKSVVGNATNNPLLCTFEDNQEKHAILLGEGIWRWRSQDFLIQGSFEGFDAFMGKLIQYLSSNKKRKRLVAEYESFYNSNDNIILTAQYFNKSYEFEPNASLSIKLINNEDSSEQILPLLFSNNNYKIDLSGLNSGDYTFTISHDSEPIALSGAFKIISFNIEQQFLTPNYSKLFSIAVQTQGEVYFPNQIDKLINNLLADSRFKTIQREIKTVVPLIDWKYLLGFIVLALSLEWFIRKYKGLI